MTTQSEKRKLDKVTSERELRRVRRMVTKAPLPNQSSAVARSLRQWVKFLMGMPADVSALPEPPSEVEVSKWQQWAPMRAKRVSEHLDGIRTKYGEKNKADGQLRYNEEVTRLRTMMAPPEFVPAPNVPSTDNFPWSAKVTCELDVQRAGFSRITFQWHASSFKSSGWNAALSAIIVQHYTNWEKTQPGKVWDGLNNMSLLLERWVRGQGREIRRAEKLGPKVEDNKIVKAKRTSIQRTKKKVRV